MTTPRTRAAGLVLACSILFSGVSTAAGGNSALTVTAGFAPEIWHPSTAPLELVLSRPVDASDPPISIWIGNSDVTGSFLLSGDRLRCGLPAPPLPAGESEFIVYLAPDSASWIEIGRFAVRILTPGGFESRESAALLQGVQTGQLAHESDPAEDESVRRTFQDVQVNSGWSTSHVRAGWTVSTQASFLGVSERSQALRFAQLGDGAPRFDLSEYEVRAQRGSAAIAIGHVQSAGADYVLEDRSGRGVQMQWTRGGSFTWSAALLSGSSIVGWDNPLGLSHRAHRVLSSTVGMELVPRRPGFVRLSATGTDGSVLPDPGFGEGIVNDAEKSRGLSVRVESKSLRERLGITGAWARSRFENPKDPLIEQGAELVPVKPVTRNAGFVETALQTLGSPQAGTRGPELKLKYRFERVAPQFRSVASSVSGDRLCHTFGAAGSWSGVQFEGGYAQEQDNLDRVPSLLTTRTRRGSLRGGMPLANLLHHGRGRRWLPVASGAISRTHQFGLGLPPNGGFASVAQIPDQTTMSYEVTASWQVGSSQAAYAEQRSNVDNHQAGRDRADFRNSARQARFTIPVGSKLLVSGEASRDGQTSLERAVSTNTLRAGGSVSWRPRARTQFVTFFSASRQADAPRSFLNRDSELRLEANQELDLLRLGARHAPIQLQLRYGRQNSTSQIEGGDPQARRSWSLNSGLTMGLS